MAAHTCRSSSSSAELQTNFVSEKPSSYYANLYKADNLVGGHVIMLGADAASKWVVLPHSGGVCARVRVHTCVSCCYISLAGLSAGW